MKASAWLAAVLAALLSAAAPAEAGDIVGADEIVKALSPAPLRKRGLTLEATDAPPPAPPSIDLNIEFELDSTNLTPPARAQLDALAEALRSDALSRSRFDIAGHTDGRGTPAYNQSLSERRSQSVRDYLVFQHGIAATQLSTSGWGFSRLKNPSDPLAPENRRVQISNIGQ